MHLDRGMRTSLLNLLPLAALTLAAACGGDGGGLPTGSWHHGTASGSGGTVSTGSGGGTGSSGGNGGTASSSSSGAGSSSGGTASSSSGSGGATSSSSSGGTASSSSGSSSGTASSGGSSGASQGDPANVAVTVGQSAVQVQLLAQTTVDVSIAPNGYTGTVQLSPGTLPTGVTGTFDKTSVMLDGTTTATATLTLQTDTDAPPGDLTLNVGVTAGETTKSAPVTLTVQSVITLHIPAGVNSNGASITNPDTTAFGPYPITIVAPQGLSSQSPVTVYFQNDDTVSHEIHADATAQGFGHDPGSFGAGKMDPYVRKVNTAGTYDFYLHDQGSPKTIGRIHIQ